MTSEGSCCGKRPMVGRLRAILEAGSSGSALVELALILPIILVLITGMFTLGVAFNNYLVLTHAVGTGARLLAVSRGETTDPCATASSAVYAAAPTLTQSKIKFTFVLNGNSYPGTTCAAGTSSLLTAVPAQITANYPAQITLFGWTPSTLTLTAQTTELIQ